MGPDISILKALQVFSGAARGGENKNQLDIYDALKGLGQVRTGKGKTISESKLAR